MVIMVSKNRLLVNFQIYKNFKTFLTAVKKDSLANKGTVRYIVPNSKSYTKAISSQQILQVN